jgi:hypothetical protein
MLVISKQALTKSPAQAGLIANITEGMRRV